MLECECNEKVNFDGCFCLSNRVRKRKVFEMRREMKSDGKKTLSEC